MYKCVTRPSTSGFKKGYTKKKKKGYTDLGLLKNHVDLYFDTVKSGN